MRIITGGISSGWMREDGMWLVCWEVTGLFATGVVVINMILLFREGCFRWSECVKINSKF
jgi:hypothetical protein